MKLFSSSPLSLGNRFSQLALIATLLIGVAWFLIPSSSLGVTQLPHVSGILGGAFDTAPVKDTPANTFPPRANHPIDELVRRANEEFEALVGRAADNLPAAAQAYRERRGRHPPPGFDAWFNYANDHSALVVEEFFDRIYDDLNPFWGVSAKQVREQANVFEFRISVRDGKVEQRSDGQDRPWMGLWADMVGAVASLLPDLDMPVNMMDESRLIVPWEEVNGYVEKERANRKLIPQTELQSRFHSLADLDATPPPPFNPEWDRDYPYWPMAVAGCPPESPARKAYIDSNFADFPPLTGQYPLQSYHGYVQNWTFATSPCDHAALQGLHGTFVEPVSLANSKKLFPLFGGSKLPMNNDILLPPAMYWTDDPFYSGGDDHGAEWSKKLDKMIWRGAASGGRNKVDNWTRFQRHRFLSMANGTSVRLAETKSELQPPNFVLPANDTYELAAHQAGAPPTGLGDWVEQWADAAAVNLLCHPQSDPPAHTCPYTDPYFRVAESLPMKKQYQNKYLPDIDGNSFSGRYRGFLRSTSLPIKATIYREWHDSRLVPWKHFVPMDNTFVDFYGIMEYFLGNRDMSVGGHDEVAESIASSGKEWADTVLRKEDMSIYVYRLLLEYARVCDDDRDRMGWAASAAP